jgi:hypothetical protein
VKYWFPARNQTYICQIGKCDATYKVCTLVVLHILLQAGGRNAVSKFKHLFGITFIRLSVNDSQKAKPQCQDALLACLRQKQARPVSERTSATCFVVANPAKPSGRAHWLAVLTGGCLLDTEAALSSGPAGAYVKYVPAVTSRRWLLIILQLYLLFPRRHH